MSELRKQTKDDLVYYVSPQLSVYPKLRHGFFTKQGGVSPAPYDSLNFRFSSRDSAENVRRNFDIAARALGSDIHHVARTCQMHTDNIVEVTGVEDFVQMGEGSGVDALVTNVPGAVLCGFYADCQLIMLYDHKHKAIGVVHAGWRGIAQEPFRSAEQYLPGDGIGTAAVVLPCHVLGKPELEQAAMTYGLSLAFPEELGFRAEFSKGGRRGELQAFQRGEGQCGFGRRCARLRSGSGGSGAEKGGGKQEGGKGRKGRDRETAEEERRMRQGKGRGWHRKKVGPDEILSRLR